jgi:hypothetical protein
MIRTAEGQGASNEYSRRGGIISTGAKNGKRVLRYDATGCPELAAGRRGRDIEIIVVFVCVWLADVRPRIAVL